MYVKKFTSFCQVLKKDAHKRKLVPFLRLMAYICTLLFMSGISQHISVGLEKNRDFFKVKKIRFMKKFVGASMYIAVVKVCSPCPRLYIAAAVAVNTTVCSMIQTWVLSHRSRTCNTPHLMLCTVTRLNTV